MSVLQEVERSRYAQFLHREENQDRYLVLVPRMHKEEKQKAVVKQPPRKVVALNLNNGEYYVYIKR